MKKKIYAVLIHPEVPASLSAMLKNHIHVYGEMKMIFALDVVLDQFGFLQADTIGADKKEGLLISLPLHYVLAVAKVDKPSENEERLGF